MTTRLTVLGFTLAAVSLASAPIQAAPPTLRTLFPAGGQRGTTVSVTAEGTFGKWPVQIWIDHEGIEVQPAAEAGKLNIAISPDAVPGPYAIRFYNEEGASVARPFLVGTLPEVLEREPNDDPKKPQMLNTSRVVVNGRLSKVGDVDTFALALKKGETLIASLEANRTLRSPMDGHMEVLSPAGFILEHNDDFHGLDPQLVFTVPSDGTYLVRTFAFPSVPDSSIRFAGGETFIYRLTLTTGPFLDYAYPLAVARSMPGEVDLVGWNLEPSIRRLAVPSPEEDCDEVTLWHPDGANTVRLRLEPHEAIVNGSSTSRAHPRQIALPVTVTGRLERAQDVDFYRFESKKGEKWTFRAEAQSLGFPLDPVLEVSDGAGKFLAKAQATAVGKDPSLDFTSGSDGPLILSVRDLFGTGSSRHVYRLRAQATTPDFALKLATERFTVLPGKPLDVSVSVERSAGFSNEIELKLEGLPEDAAAETLPAGKNAKTMTLRLTAGQTPFSGPVRLIGMEKNVPGKTRLAQATVADLGTLTDKLWLTVAK